jgi:hypothetical protein
MNLSEEELSIGSCPFVREPPAFRAGRTDGQDPVGNSDPCIIDLRQGLKLPTTKYSSARPVPPEDPRAPEYFIVDSLRRIEIHLLFSPISPQLIEKLHFIQVGCKCFFWAWPEKAAVWAFARG